MLVGGKYEFKELAIALNVLWLMLCVFLYWHGTPKSVTLWSSAILWALRQ